MCDRWLNSFENFLDDMGIRPSKTHSIERINNSRGYEPSNCRWATRKEQSLNTRNNKMLYYKGDVKSMLQFCNDLGLNYFMIRRRLDLGWSVKDAFETGRGKLPWSSNLINHSFGLTL